MLAKIEDEYKNIDLYTYAASKYYNVSYSEVTINQRSHAKRAMFLYMYSGIEYSAEDIINLGLWSMRILYND